MTNVAPTVPNPLAGQPDQALQAQSQAPVQGTEQTEPITKAELQALEGKLLAQMQRLAQSQADRSTAGLRKQLDDKIATLTAQAQALGAPEAVIKQQVEALWQEQMRAILNGEVEEQDVDDGPTPEEVAMVQGKIIDIAEELNVPALTPRDPEYATLNLQERDPNKFLAQFKSAMEQKALRKYGPDAVNRQLSNPDARVPMANAGALSGNPTLDQMTTQLTALQRKNNRTSADWEQMRKLQEAIQQQLT